MIYIYDSLESIKYDDYLEIKGIIRKYNNRLIKNYISYKDRLNNVLSIFILIIYLYQNNKIEEILTYAYSQKNKPIMNNTKFNISHCSEAIAVAVHNNEEVGIDVETEIYNYNELKKYVLSNNEDKCNIINEKKFRKIWTLKESLLKYKGDGLLKDMRKIDFSKFIDKTEFKFNNLQFCYYEFEKYSISVCCLKKLHKEIVTYEEIKKYIEILK